jgi:hypothetical protein
MMIVRWAERKLASVDITGRKPKSEPSEAVANQFILSLRTLNML